MQLTSNATDIKGGFMPDQNVQFLFQQIEDAMKLINLKAGDFVSFSDEHRRMHISPYRMTLEIRFPDGIDQLRS